MAGASIEPQRKALGDMAGMQNEISVSPEHIAIHYFGNFIGVVVPLCFSLPLPLLLLPFFFSVFYWPRASPWRPNNV